MYTCSFSWNPVIEYAVATDNPYSFVLSLPPGYHNFMSTTNNNDIYFLSTPHCLTLICISNFHTDNWATRCSVLPPSCSDTPSVAQKETPRGAPGSGCRDLLPGTLNSGLGIQQVLHEGSVPFPAGSLSKSDQVMAGTGHVRGCG